MSSLQSCLSVAAIFFLLHAISSVDAILPILDPNNILDKTCNASTVPGLCKKSLSSLSTGIFASQRVQNYMIRVSRELNNTKGTDAQILSAVNYCVYMVKDAFLQMNGTKNIALSVITTAQDDLDMTFDDIDINIDRAGGYLSQCREKWNTVQNGTIKTDVCGRTQRAGKFVGAARDAIMQLREKMSSGSAESPPPAGCKACTCCPDKKLGPGGCCQCCDPPPLPSMRSTADQNAELMCEPDDEECKKWARETA
ncbi:hypothetical protein ACHQM5_013652 [Ranunculus cassubicifolius]